MPLEFRNTPAKVEVLSDSVNAVDIRVLASSSLVKRINPSEISATINLSNWSLGERTYKLTGENIRLPFGAVVTKITPNTIRLRFEPTHQKSVEIRPRIVGRPAEGYSVSSVSCIPPKLKLKGLAAISRIFSLSIQIVSILPIDILRWTAACKSLRKTQLLESLNNRKFWLRLTSSRSKTLALGRRGCETSQS